MKTFVLAGVVIASLPLTSRALPPGAYADDADQISRTVIHKDGTYTTTARDRDSRKLIRETKRRNDTLVMRSEFSLDQFGRERKGRVYDGQKNLLFTSEFIYNNEGKAQEERVYNAQGKLVRRLMYQYDRFGKSKPFCATYQNGRPIGDLVPLDDASVNGAPEFRSGTISRIETGRGDQEAQTQVPYFQVPQVAVPLVFSQPI
jgi:hypothetical protein